MANAAIACTGLLHGRLRQQWKSRTKDYEVIWQQTANFGVSYDCDAIVGKSPGAAVNGQSRWRRWIADGAGLIGLIQVARLKLELLKSPKAKVALAVAIVLSTAFSTSAATKQHRRVIRVDPAIYDIVPGATCSPIHPPFCSNICTGSGPCAPPDSW